VYNASCLHSIVDDGSCEGKDWKLYHWRCYC